MYGHRTSPLNKTAKHGSAQPVFPSHHSSNPFDSDDEEDNRQRLFSPRRGSDRDLATRTVSNNPFDDDSNIEGSAPSYSLSSAKSRYKNDFRDAGGLENQAVQELENYSLYKAEETTKTVNNCLKIAEDMREGATKTLVTLHQQGDQLMRTHAVAADIDHDLSRGEKLLGSLGGIFSRTWRPKKTCEIVGPVMMRDDTVQRKGDHLEQREKLGLSSGHKEQKSSRTPPSQPTDALQKVKLEKLKQDDTLSDLSNLLGELKDMAIDMGSEIERHNKLLQPLEDDVEELNFRVKGANQRARRLLGK
ncbi:SNAP25-like proteinous protein SNAP33 [Heracleum sosnowskyi]|uniref:SNAP25-like proteinous protein SNAP33 n=1 Tax=Heracleum sosnowskyi TaxID=360622 RepID=A0AAD8HUE7_9APIA|nr:SNAP25-like proteinous protein SNAP33 [Heracleum sosnowskyi]